MHKRNETSINYFKFYSPSIVVCLVSVMSQQIHKNKRWWFEIVTSTWIPNAWTPRERSSQFVFVCIYYILHKILFAFFIEFSKEYTHTPPVLSYNLCKRWKYIENVYCLFCCIMKILFFSSILLRKKWKNDKEHILSFGRSTFFYFFFSSNLNHDLM